MTSDTDTERPDPKGPPHLRVVRGDPTPEELAVITALVSAAGNGGEPKPQPQRGRWSDPFDAHQRPWQFGPNGWRSALR